ncbi:protein PAT1 homolog 2 isoform X2 [Sceloporus undulatus]|uniref:protein PAT1 homolog 2 isoform X2 n=1 Tax=Sceloporus undulatus TaxID=8520 RepID=UPI001C4D705E|nr:protein PAT1 homolog 2 isoform X2 [Sceloporus undulatus]
MAEGGEVEAREMILEDFFMMDEEPVVDKTAEEDEIDLYINLTFTSSAYIDENGAKVLVIDPEQAPMGELEEVMVSAAGEEQSKAVEEEKSKATDTEPMLEDVADNGSPHTEPQLVCDAMEEEEAAMAEQEEDHISEETEERNDLGDPAVMRAVRGQSTLEREDSSVLDSRMADSLQDYSTDYLTASKSGMWSPTLRRVPSLSMMEAMERASMSQVDLDFLASPVQSSYPDSSGLERSVLRGRTVKPSSQRFMRQQSPMMPGSVRSPYPFTPPRRTRRTFGLNQTSGYASPPPFRPFFSNINSPTWSLTHIPDVPSFSPSTGSQQKFSLPSALTQLHPLHQRILTQRQRGQKRMQRIESQPLDKDPYASLMTAVEKDWVVKVQMLQLQSENPQRDDYYYQEYYHKLEHKQAEKGLFGGSRPEVPKLVTPYIQKVETYESVVRIPGSLGQVAVSTCYSPRRAIDAVHHISLEQAVGNQRLHVLYQIEKMYLQLLAMEDTRRKLDLAPEEQHSHFCEKFAHEVGRIYQTLRIEEHSSEEEAKDEFLQILLVGKGKRLVARLLPHLSQEQAKQVLVAVAQHLPFLIKKDMLDETLPILYSPLSVVIEQLTFTELIDVLQDLTRMHPESVKQSLAMIFGNKFAISFLYLLLSHGERCLSSGMPLKPHNGDFKKWVNTVLLVARELSQVPKASMVEPLHLPTNLLFLFCRYVDKDTVNCLDVKMDAWDMLHVCRVNLWKWCPSS